MGQLNSEVGEYSQSSGLGTRRARQAMVAVGLLFVSYEVFRGIPAAQPWVWLSYAAGVLGAFLLTSAGHNRLSSGRAGLLVVLSLMTATALFAQPGDNPRSWIYSYAAYLLALMVARGNRIAGGIGGALLLLMGVFVLCKQDSDYGAYVALLDVAVTALAAGYVWRWWFVRMVRRERELRAATVESRQDAAASEASIDSIRQAYSEVHEVAAPLLSSLSSGEFITPSSQQAFGIIEAEIRDRLVAPGMMDPALAHAVRELRHRGARVTLLGHVDEDGSSHPITRVLAARLVQELRAGEDVIEVTIRQHPTGSPAAWTLLIVDARGRTRQRYTEQGTLLPTGR